MTDIFGHKTEEQKEKDKINADLKRDARNREISDFNYVLKSPEGRRFIWRLIAESGVYRTTFSKDHAEMAFLEGKRIFGLMLTAELEDLAPDKYLQMKREFNSERKNKQNGNDTNK